MIQKGIVAVSGKAIGKAFVLCGIPQITGEEKSRCEKEVVVQHIRKVIDSLAEIMAVSYTHLTLPTKLEV